MPANKDQKRETWVCRFEYKDWKGETRTVYKRGFLTRRDAVQYEMDFKLRLAGDLDMSFADFVKVYREERYARLRESTSSMKDYIIEDKILPYFGRMKMREISSTDVVRWQNELLGFKKSKGGESYSRTYLKTVHNQLSAIFNYAVRYYHLQNNPARIAGNIGNESEIEMDFWTLEEYKKFSAVMAEKPEYFYAFEVLYWLGLREGELLALLKDLDPASNVWSRRNPRQIWSTIDSDIDVDKDYFDIVSDKFLREEEKSFVNENPELLKDWDYDLNKNTNPKSLTKGCGIIINWKCHICGYKWKAKIPARLKGAGCPCCNKNVLVQGVNDFANNTCCSAFG